MPPTGSGVSPTGASQTAKNDPAAAEGVPPGRVHAHAAARLGRRPDALADLLPVPHPVRRHHVLLIDEQLPDRLEVPARRHVPAPTSLSPTSPACCSSSASAGRSCAATCRRRTACSSRRGPRTAPSSARSSLIGLSGFLTEAVRIAVAERPDFEKWSIVGYPLSAIFEGWAVARHVARQARGSSTSPAFMTFLILLPTTKLRHMFTSPVNMYLSDRDRPKGAMKPLPNLMETSARDVRRQRHRGLHVEAAARHRRVHGVRSLHERVPGARHGQAARPARDRAEGRPRDGGHRRQAGRSRRSSARTPS